MEKCGKIMQKCQRMTRGAILVCSLTVSKEALVVLDSSGMPFFPVKTCLRFFLTSLLKITWKKKMKTPCEESEMRFVTNRGARTKDVSLRYKHDPLSYLQTAEDREQVVEGHHVAVDRH